MLHATTASAEPKIGLVGYTGFVGSTILKTLKCSHLYNSKNIETLKNEEFDRLIFTAMPAAKWQVNQNPKPDEALVQYFAEVLKTVKTKEFILISTIDVYGAKDHDGMSDETTTPNPDNYYGLHRYQFEQVVRDLFPDAYIIRLPGLFGNGLKKNCIYDFIKNNRTSFILTNSSFQWYDMSCLVDDIESVVEQGIKLINLFPEPLETEAILDSAKKMGFVFEEPADKVKRGASYHIKTKFGSGYIYDRQTTIKKLERFLAQERISKSLGVSTIGWNFQNTKETVRVLDFFKTKGISKIEIAPTSIWGSWEGAKKALESGAVRDFALDLEQKGFLITSMQAILYQLPDIQLFSNDSQLEDHFKFLYDLSSAISVQGQSIKIVFGAPKNRNHDENLSSNNAEVIASEKLLRLAELANGKYATFCIEANPPAYGCEFLNTLEKAKAFVEKYPHPNLKFMIDTGCATLGSEDLSVVTQDFIEHVAHVHLSQPFLGAFKENQEFHKTLQLIKPAILKNPTWIIETRNTGAVEDLENTVNVVMKELERVLVSA